MNKSDEVISHATEMVIELSKNTPDDLLELKLMVLADAKQVSEKVFLFVNRVFELAEARLPLMIEMK